MIDAAERALLAATFGSALGGAGEDADSVLTKLGWLELLQGEPREAIDIVFDALGTTNAAASALDDVLSFALGIEPRADLAVLLPRFGAWEAPGQHGLATARVTVARELLVVSGSGSELHATILSTESVNARPVRGIDPDAGFHTVRVEPAAAGEAPLDPAAWESAVALGRRATAQQIAGACRAMLALARRHALERIQFGRPVASFQAVRHRLADALVAVEALDATLHAAGDEPNPVTAALAKATAGRTARTVTTHCQQVLAGIGFTTDHPLHRFLKRTMLLEGLFGSTDDIARDIGRQLLRERRVPTLIEL